MAESVLFPIHSVFLAHSYSRTRWFRMGILNRRSRVRCAIDSAIVSYEFVFLCVLLGVSIVGNADQSLTKWGTSQSLIKDPGYFETEDSIIIEAPGSDASLRSSRQKRQFLTFAVPTVLAVSPCVSSRGLLGQCMRFKQCYPYLKLPDFVWEPIIFDTYDSCTYFSADGSQRVGVCCTSPINSGYPIVSQDLAEEPETPSVPGFPFNWPPPVPTHPPDHTAATHPPSLGSSEATTEGAAVTTTTEGSKIDTACGQKNGYQDQERIVGGQNAEQNEWPWVVAIFTAGKQFCGGSLIDTQHILTAAHCVAHMSSWDVAKLTVNLGDHNIKQKNEVNHVERKIKRLVRHKSFDMRTLYNDVAILTMDKPVKYTDTIRAICLPRGRAGYEGKIATVIGWGSLRESGPQPAVLQKVNIPVWTNSECKARYGPAAPGGIVDHMICAGRATKDSCTGDSGGPLMVNEGKWTQVGIVSWGIGCGKGEYPGVYSRVTYFMPWITKNLKKN
uniref:Phenoloxidase-activating factor 2 n=2 Tax=Cacopsylla melanoneura TaxID=428564 RepID=A0A8D8VB12_9HEMI